MVNSAQDLAMEQKLVRSVVILGNGINKLGIEFVDWGREGGGYNTSPPISLHK